MADQLRQQGLYSIEIEHVMQEVLDLRNASQHEYWILAPEQVHAAVERQRQYLPAFVSGVGTWVEGLRRDR